MEVRDHSSDLCRMEHRRQTTAYLLTDPTVVEEDWKT